MNAKDRVSLIISIVALLLSATANYFTFVRVATEASAIIVGFMPTSRTKTHKLQAAVFNTGNRQVAITDAELYLVQVDGSEHLRQPMTTVKRTAFPVVVQPGTLALIDCEAEVEWGTVIAYHQQIPLGDDH